MASPPVITVHLLSDSAGWRIVWLLEELELSYNIAEYKRAPLQAPEELKKAHPLGKSPVVEIKENGKTITLAEAGAICEYLVERYGHGRFSGPADDRATYLYWMHFASGSLMPLVTQWLVLNVAGQQAPFLARPLVRAVGGGLVSSYLRPELKKQLTFIEAELGEKPYFVGNELSAADVMMLFPLDGLVAADLLTSSAFPHLTQWLARLRGREAYKRTAGKCPEPNMKMFL